MKNLRPLHELWRRLGVALRIDVAARDHLEWNAVLRIYAKPWDLVLSV